MLHENQVDYEGYAHKLADILERILQIEHVKVATCPIFQEAAAIHDNFVGECGEHVEGDETDM